MKKGTKITIKITYNMYLLLTRDYKRMNNIRIEKGLKEYDNKSQYYNQILRAYVLGLTKANSREYDEWKCRRISDTLKKYDYKNKKCKIINFIMEGETAWYMRHYINEFNKENHNKNTYHILVMYCEKIKGQN